MRYFRYFSLIVFLICLVGCIPYSDNPLTDPSEQTVDASICGAWFWKEKNETGYIHIGLDKKTKLLRVIMLEHDLNGELNASEFSGHTSSTADGKYLNLKWVSPADENPGYFFVKYEVQEATLGISLMDAGVVGNAIKNGLLRGEVKGDDWFSSVHITAEHKELHRFVGKNDRELFKETTYVNRFSLPSQ